MYFLRKFLYSVSYLVLLVGFIYGVFIINEVFLQKKYSVSDESRNYTGLGKEIFEAREDIANKFPDSTGPVEKIFQWTYQGKNYQISQNLYSSIYSFYKGQPKTYTYFNELPADWEEEYYGMFLVKNEKSNFAKEILSSIISQGKKNKLSDDQMVELVLTFVQTIPYDEKKAETILLKTGKETMNYPYETLFENTGVCSDKSFLAVSLLKELGFGTAIFVYDNENHMAIGIQCPIEYSNYGSGYCYGETTSIGNKIGIIPELKSYAGRAVGGQEISYFTENGEQDFQTTQLSEVKIFQQTKGLIYEGIAQTIKTNKEIAKLKDEISFLLKKLKDLKNNITEMQDDLASQRKKLDKYLKEGDIDKHNEKAKDYNDDLSSYEEMIDEYNEKVNSYNDKVARYNYLLKL